MYGRRKCAPCASAVPVTCPFGIDHVAGHDQVLSLALISLVSISWSSSPNPSAPNIKKNLSNDYDVLLD